MLIDGNTDRPLDVEVTRVQGNPWDEHTYYASADGVRYRVIAESRSCTYVVREDTPAPPGVRER